jgi:hypothetical protein
VIENHQSGHVIAAGCRGRWFALWWYKRLEAFGAVWGVGRKREFLKKYFPGLGLGLDG